MCLQIFGTPGGTISASHLFFINLTYLLKFCGFKEDPNQQSSFWNKWSWSYNGFILFIKFWHFLCWTHDKGKNKSSCRGLYSNNIHTPVLTCFQHFSSLEVINSFIYSGGKQRRSRSCQRNVILASFVSKFGTNPRSSNSWRRKQVTWWL